MLLVSVPQNLNCVEVEVLLVRDDFEDMPAGGERYAQLADPLEGVPAAGVGHGNAAGDVDAIDFDVEAGRWRPVAIACSEFDVVLGAGGHVDGIGEPLSGLEVVHDITTAQGVGGHDDVHVLARPVLTPGIAFDRSEERRVGKSVDLDGREKKTT